MVVLKNPNEYRLVRFQVCDDKKHKYNAILENKKTKVLKKIPFGGIKSNGTPYEHYHDKIGHYRKYDHNDKHRRQLYRIRHKGEDQMKFSSGWFSWRYLW